MWIERIRIDKFGGLRSAEMELTQGLTVLLGGNESGKTTVCAFIRAMLYGLNGKSTSIMQNERKKYMPWGENTMGGSLRLRNGQHSYEIVRVFGLTRKSDSCRVVDVNTGEVVPIPAGQEPGQVLLGVGESVYLDALHVSFRGGRLQDGAELADRIRNRLDTGEEEIDPERVQERLQRARNAIAPRMQDKGALAQVRRELDEARRLLMKEEALKQEMAQLKKAAHRVPEERAEALAKSLEETDLRIRAQEELLLKQDERERAEKRPARWLAALALLAAAAGMLLGIYVSRYFSGLLLPAAGLLAWVAVLAGKRRAQRQKSVDAVLGELSQLRQDQAMLRQQMQLMRGGETEEAFLRSRLALERVAQELKQLQAVRAQAAALEKKEEELLFDVQALDMALEEMRAAAKERREGVSPRIRQDMEDMLCGLTGARYDRAALSEALAVSVQNERGEMRPLEYFSGGTVEQMYLALRLSLIRHLEEAHGTLPVILDDPLAQYDDERAEDALQLLGSFAQEGRQVILMTCRGRDTKGAKRVVRMEKV